MFRIFSFSALFLSFLGFLITPMSVNAQSEIPELRLKNSGSMGFVPSYPSPITSNITNDLGVSTVNLPDTNRTISALGCGAMDNIEARKIILNSANGGEVEDYLNTTFASYMVTTLYNSPAIAEIYNGVEDFASPRVRELQDRCAAMEYKDDLAPVQWEAVQRCVNKNIAADGGDSKEDIAVAFVDCLSSPDRDGADGTLRESTEEILTSRKWNGSLFSALENTSACVDTTNGKRCDLFAFIPNVRWCMLTDKSTFKECSQITAVATNTGPGNTATGSTTQDMIISAEAISPKQVFDAAYGISEAFVNYAMVYAEALYQHPGVGIEKATKIAMKGENLNANTKNHHIGLLATKQAVLNGFHGAGAELTSSNGNGGGGPGVGTLSAALSFDNEFANYTNCGAAFDSTASIFGDHIWENFDELVINGIPSTWAQPKIDALFTALPDSLSAGTIYGDFFDKTVIGLSDSSVGSANSPVRNIYDASYASNAIIIATKCTMHDTLRLSLSDYLGLLFKPNSKDAALLGYRTQVAYAATRSLLKFIVHRLELAKLDLAMNITVDPNSPPPHVRKAVETIISSLNGRINEMEARRKQQRNYADIIARFQ